MNTSDGAAVSSTSESSLDDTLPLAPAEMLALLTEQQRTVTAKMGGFVPVIMATWGGAWLLGFGALWLIDGLRPAFSLPIAVAVGVFIAVLVVAIGASIWLGVRSSRGVKSGGGSDFSGTVYGVTWTAGSLAIGAIGGALVQNGLSPELANLFYPSIFIFFVGVMYIMAGAIWRAVPSVVAGGWLLLLAAVAPFLGYPWHYLLFALAGGLGFLAFSILGRNLLNGSREFTPAAA